MATAEELIQSIIAAAAKLQSDPGLKLPRWQLDALGEADRTLWGIVEDRGAYCEACKVPAHDTCGMMVGCPCCDNTTD